MHCFGRVWNSSISIVTRFKTGVRFLAGAEISTFPQILDCLGPDHLPPSSAKVKNACSYTSTLPHA
jgi:hypothetical protein